MELNFKRKRALLKMVVWPNPEESAVAITVMPELRQEALEEGKRTNPPFPFPFPPEVGEGRVGLCGGVGGGGF